MAGPWSIPGATFMWSENVCYADGLKPGHRLRIVSQLHLFMGAVVHAMCS